MDVVKGVNLNDITVKLLERIITNGHKTTSRNGDVSSLYDVSIILDNPKARHLNLIGRKNNIFATFAETFWVLAGGINIHPYLSFFVPRAQKYSDDGITWRGAYGERIYAYGQLENVIQQFKIEGITSRRAVISLYMPNRDTEISLKNKYNIPNSLDIPCNNLIHFFITPDKKLNIKIIQRSGDIIFGVSNINIFEFSLLQELVLHILRIEVDNELTLGYLHHSVTNLHLYDKKREQAISILANKHKQNLKTTNDNKIFFANSIAENKEFFRKIVDELSNKISTSSDELEPFKCARNKLKFLFKKFKVPVINNILWGYAEASLSFIYQQKQEHKIKISGNYGSDFNESIENNYFNKNKRDC